MPAWKAPLYNIYSPSATFTLNGIMYLHQNDTFYQMAVNGLGIPAGVYSYSQLAAAFPTNFPGIWNTIYGSTNYLGSGSITVLNTLITPPVITSGKPPDQAEEFAGARNELCRHSATGNQATYQWFLNGSAIAGATNSSLILSPVLEATNTYSCVLSNFSAGVVTALTETNVAVDPPVSVTFDDTANWTSCKAAGSLLLFPVTC